MNRRVFTCLSVAAVVAVAACGSTEQRAAPSATTPAPATSSAPPRTATTSQSSTQSSSPRSRSSTSTTSAAEGRPTTAPAKKGTPRGPLPDPKKVDERNAAAVATAYTRTAWTFDTRVDASRNDAQRRAARWLTGDLAAQLEKGLPGGTGWSDLTKKHAWTTVKVTDVTPAGGDPTKGLTADRVQQVEVTTRDKNHKPIGRATSSTTAITLERSSTSQPWRVSDMQTY